MHLNIKYTFIFYSLFLATLRCAQGSFMLVVLEHICGTENKTNLPGESQAKQAQSNLCLFDPGILYDLALDLVCFLAKSVFSFRLNIEM